jgi:hypothetical protein
MNSSLLNKENNYSLHNLDNYYNSLNYTSNEILKKYMELIIEYLKFIFENIKVKNNDYSKFIIIRGYDSITNVFSNILYYTKNLDLTFYHCQKSYYYYVEFIEQIFHDSNIFLQLTSKDATTYVYKKTIYDLNYDIKKNMGACPNETKLILEKLDQHILIFKNIIDTIIGNITLDISLNSNVNQINIFGIICKKILNSNLEIQNCKILYKNINDTHFENIDNYFTLLLNLIKNLKQKKTKNKITNDLCSKL